MASPTWATPALCSRLAALISPMMSVTRRMALTTSVMVVPALSARALPCSTRATLSEMRVLISFAASALRPASWRTSPATTAKPRPCSPARAASTAAFSARMLVWKAMPSITPMMSAILWLLASMSRMVCTTCPTTPPACSATCVALRASWLACWALSAFWRTVEPSCSMEAAVCSSALAWLSVRPDRSWLPWAISLLAVATLSAPWRTSCTMCAMLSRMARMPCVTLLLSRVGGISTVRSPLAMLCVMALSCAGSAPSWRKMLCAMIQLTASSSSPSRAVMPPACASRFRNVLCTVSVYTPEPMTQPQGAKPLT